MMKNVCSILLIVFSFTIAFSQTTDAQGRKQGYWKKKDEKTEKLIYEGLFKDNKPQGVFKYYYPFDTVKAIIDFKQDGKFAYAKLFHPTGKIMAKGKYLGESVKDSVWLYYDDLGVMMSKENFVNGKKEGKALVYFPDGKIAEESAYKNDVKNGPFKQYFDGTRVKHETTYLNGQMEGKCSYYFPNGTTAATGYYKNGLRNGPWIYRESDGKIKEKELWENGQLADKKKTDEFFAKNKVKDSEPAKTQKGTKEKTQGTKPVPKKN